MDLHACAARAGFEARAGIDIKAGSRVPGHQSADALLALAGGKKGGLQRSHLIVHYFPYSQSSFL